MAAGLLLEPGAAGAADRPNGVLLVAHPDLLDPHFRQTVVLATRHAHGGAVGVVLNRPTDVPVREVLPDRSAFRHSTEVVFWGGPVSPATLVFVLRSASPLAGALRILSDVYMSLDAAALDGVTGSVASADARVYRGYAGWAPGQLDREIRQGGWYVLDPDPEAIFGADRASLWRTLLRRATAREVRATPARPARATLASRPVQPR